MNLYENHLFFAISIQIIATVVLVSYVVAFAGGWWSLSRRYRTEYPMPPGSFLSGATFRYVVGYNNVLRLGSDTEGLYLTFWPRIGHPPLFIPWHEVEVKAPRRIILKMQTLVLGQEQKVPVTMREKDVRRLLLKAGKSNIAIPSTGSTLQPQ